MRHGVIVFLGMLKGAQGLPGFGRFVSRVRQWRLVSPSGAGLVDGGWLRAAGFRLVVNADNAGGDVFLEVRVAEILGIAGRGGGEGRGWGIPVGQAVKEGFVGGNFGFRVRKARLVIVVFRLQGSGGQGIGPAG